MFVGGWNLLGLLGTLYVDWKCFWCSGLFGTVLGCLGWNEVSVGVWDWVWLYCAYKTYILNTHFCNTFINTQHSDSPIFFIILNPQGIYKSLQTNLFPVGTIEKIVHNSFSTETETEKKRSVLCFVVGLHVLEIPAKRMNRFCSD